MLTPERVKDIEANLDEARECLRTGKGLRQWLAVYHADVAPLLAGYAELAPTFNAMVDGLKERDAAMARVAQLEAALRMAREALRHATCPWMVDHDDCPTPRALADIAAALGEP